ncbi:MAG: hypothetical protein PHD97_02340 [Bacteroidales bacterium]|nr:hypothetical protein [Bacteroidales bacterium]
MKIIIETQLNRLLYVICFGILFSCNNNKVSEKNDTKKTDTLKKDSIKKSVFKNICIDIENTSIIDIGKYKIHIKKIDYKLVKNDYEKIKEKAYNSSGNYFEAQEKIEKQFANKYKTIFKRNKDTLKVFNKYTFIGNENNIDSTQNYGYTFDNYYPKSNSCLIYVGHENRYKYILYNKISSTRVILDGMPHFSENGNKFISLALPNVKNKTQDIISYYEITDYNFILIGGFNLKNKYIPSNARWIENNKFIIEFKNTDSKDKEAKEYFEFTMEVK